MVLEAAPPDGRGDQVPPDTLATLREVNQNLREALFRLQPERKACASIQPGDLSDLEAQIARAAECLRLQSAPVEFAADLEREKLAYRRNLEELKQFLPSLHVRLVAEKARLEAARQRLAAADSWAQARRKIL